MSNNENQNDKDVKDIYASAIDEAILDGARLGRDQELECVVQYLRDAGMVTEDVLADELVALKHRPTGGEKTP